MPGAEVVENKKTELLIFLIGFPDWVTREIVLASWFALDARLKLHVYWRRFALYLQT